MDKHDCLAQHFEENRTHLRAVAYRMLGSLSEVDDAVQEAWLRLSRADAGGIDNLGGWLTTVVARVCLDMLRSRQSRREEPFAADAPEPAADGPSGVIVAPQGRLTRALRFTIANGRITEIEIIGNQERLAGLEVSVLESW